MLRSRLPLRSAGAVTDLLLVAIFVTLAYIFLTRRGYLEDFSHSLSLSRRSADSNMLADQSHQAAQSDIHAPQLLPEKAESFAKDKKTQDKISRGEPNPGVMQNPKAESFTKDEKTQDKIALTVSRIPDVREESCKSARLDSQHPCSIIVHFFDYEFYDLRYTLTSVLQHTPQELIREIIVVDDGSTLEYIIREAAAYVSLVAKAVLLRSETQGGVAAARMRGAREAQGGTLVFLDGSVLVSPGWLTPLATAVQTHSNRVAVPHMDKVRDPVTYEYVKLNAGLVPSFGWNMEITVAQNYDYDVTKPTYDVTVMRGNVFAVTREYFAELRGLDEGLSEGGGSALEFSLRTWLCGGSIHIIPCSRVGILNLRDPVKITSSRNVWRIGELWLGDNKQFVYSQQPRDPASSVTSREEGSLTARRGELGALQCRDFRWFLETVATDMYLPPSNVTSYGLLQIKNGRCTRVDPTDWRIDLGSCSPEQEKRPYRDMVVEWTREGQLRSLGRCLTVQPTAYILADPCTAGSDHQQWDLDGQGRLVNRWSGYCAMHVTDPDPKLRDAKRQIVMAQSCGADSTGEKREFSGWAFLKS